MTLTYQTANQTHLEVSKQALEVLVVVIFKHQLVQCSSCFLWRLNLLLLTPLTHVGLDAGCLRLRDAHTASVIPVLTLVTSDVESAKKHAMYIIVFGMLLHFV